MPIGIQRKEPPLSKVVHKWNSLHICEAYYFRITFFHIGIFYYNYQNLFLVVLKIFSYIPEFFNMNSNLLNIFYDEHQHYSPLSPFFYEALLLAMPGNFDKYLITVNFRAWINRTWIASMFHSEPCIDRD